MKPVYSLEISVCASCSLFSCFLYPLVCVTLSVAQCMYSNFFLPDSVWYLSTLVAYPPLISVTSWSTICCQGNDQRCVAWSAMITGLHCSAVFSSQFTETSFVLQYISSCVTNMLNQFRAYVSAYHCRKYISPRASHTLFCVHAATLLQLAFVPLSDITLLVWRRAFGRANF